MEACGRQLLALKALLTTFGESTGLKVNNQKSIMVPINTPQEELQHLVRILNCAVGQLPFTYFGLPLSLNQPKAINFSPLVTKFERRLAATSVFLNQAGRLEVINSIITAMPLFSMSTFIIHQGVIQ